PARFGMVSLTLTPFAPWQAAHTASTLALPAPISAARAAGAKARDSKITNAFFMFSSSDRGLSAAYAVIHPLLIEYSALERVRPCQSRFRGKSGSGRI